MALGRKFYEVDSMLPPGNAGKIAYSFQFFVEEKVIKTPSVNSMMYQ